MWHMVYSVQVHRHHSAQLLMTLKQNYQLPNREADFPSSHSQSNDTVVVISLMMQVLHAIVTPLYCASNTIKQTKTPFKSK
jgi:hypothetical protein